MPKFLTLDELARELKTPRYHLAKLLRAGIIKADASQANKYLFAENSIPLLRHQAVELHPHRASIPRSYLSPPLVGLEATA